MVAWGATIASQLTSLMAGTMERVFGGARMLRICWMSSTVALVLGASCAAWAEGGEGRFFQRREAAAVAYMAAITMMCFSPSMSRGMVASGEECDGPFGSRRGMCRLI